MDLSSVWGAIGDAFMPNCDHCHQDRPNLITLAEHTVCQNCIEVLAQGVGVKKRRLSRKRVGKQIAGVCAGIADHVEVDRDTVRVLFIVLTVFTGFLPLLISYAVLTYFLPIED